MSEAAPDTRRLETVLAAEERLYVELRDLLQRERECMVNLDATGLEDVVLRKEELAGEARLLEETRIQVAGALARELGLREPRPTLSELCDRLEGRASGLREAHTRLVALLGAVRELADANAVFAGDSLAQVRASLELLGRLLPTQPTYRPDARAEATLPAGRLLRRSA